MKTNSLSLSNRLCSLHFIERFINIILLEYHETSLKNVSIHKRLLCILMNTLQEVIVPVNSRRIKTIKREKSGFTK